MNEGNVALHSGIYKIVNNVNGKIYVGSAKNIKKRWSNHKYLLNNNKHYNNHLQSSWVKYGKDNFTFDVLEYTSESTLIEREDYWIAKTKCIDRTIGYNKRLKANSNLGIKMPKEMGEKIRRLKTGKKLSKEHIEKVRLSQIGRVQSEATRKKISEAHKGKKFSDETIQKMSKAQKGKKMTKEVREKISNSHRGQKRSDEAVKVMTEKRRERAKLTAEDVIKIKELFEKTSLNNAEIARIYNVTKDNIWRIRKNLIWKDIVL